MEQPPADRERKVILQMEQEQERWRYRAQLDWRSAFFSQLWKVSGLLSVMLFIAFAGVQIGKYSLEKERLALEWERARRQVPAPGEVTIQSGSTPGKTAGGAATASDQPSPGVYVLRDLLDILPQILPQTKDGKLALPPNWGTKVTDALVQTGKMTAEEAIKLRGEITKALLDVGVDGAKAVIDRFIRGKEETKSGNPERVAAGGVGNHVEITINGQKDYLPAPRIIVEPPPRIRPKPPKPAPKPAPCAAKPPPCPAAPCDKAGDAKTAPGPASCPGPN